MNNTLLEVRNLRIAFHHAEGVVQAVDGVSFAIQRGEIVGLKRQCRNATRRWL